MQLLPARTLLAFGFGRVCFFKKTASCDLRVKYKSGKLMILLFSLLVFLLLLPQSLLPPLLHSFNLNHPSLRPAAVYHLAAVCGY